MFGASSRSRLGSFGAKVVGLDTLPTPSTSSGIFCARCTSAVARQHCAVQGAFGHRWVLGADATQLRGKFSAVYRSVPAFEAGHGYRARERLRAEEKLRGGTLREPLVKEEAGKVRFQLAVLAGLGAIAGCLHLVSLSDWIKHPRYAHEEVWVGSRGIFSSDRAIVLLPLVACAGSGLLATVIAVRFPLQASWVVLPASAHELLALPLAILLAFRFDKSYERWWSCRIEVENLGKDITSLALVAKTNLDSSSTSNDSKLAKLAEANSQKLFSLLQAICDLVAARMSAESEKSSDQDHRKAKVAPASLGPDDAEMCLAAEVDGELHYPVPGFSTCRLASELQATCASILQQLGPSAPCWERACVDRWSESWWWKWRGPVLAAGLGTAVV
ncbi:unnamed protein product [Polarella glacialis]|uniref:Uncharacterized protein n=1 Tax=Polarella glacialis TaxID=89957 RepID=A0A813LCK3_POLGL|nr:unnamed protein product [Polarella glacialis]